MALFEETKKMLNFNSTGQLSAYMQSYKDIDAFAILERFYGDIEEIFQERSEYQLMIEELLEFSSKILIKEDSKMYLIGY